MGARYGKLLECVGDVVVTSGLTANALKLFIWSTRYFKSADKLKGCEAEMLRAWIDENAPEIERRSVQVAQFSHRQAADVFNGSHTESGRQIGRLIEAGILEPIGKPSRGHCQLYVVCPELHTSKCVQNDTTDLHTLNSQLAHIDGAICTHAEAVNCDYESYPNISNNYPSAAITSAVEKADESPLKCPKCGKSESVRITDSGTATCSCGSAWFPKKQQR